MEEIKPEVAGAAVTLTREDMVAALGEEAVAKIEAEAVPVEPEAVVEPVEEVVE